MSAKYNYFNNTPMESFSTVLNIMMLYHYNYETRFEAI